MRKRLAVAVPLAAVVTVGLFPAMRMLMDVSPERPDPGNRPIVEAGRTTGESASAPETVPDLPAETIYQRHIAMFCERRQAGTEALALPAQDRQCNGMPVFSDGIRARILFKAC